MCKHISISFAKRTLHTRRAHIHTQHLQFCFCIEGNSILNGICLVDLFSLGLHLWRCRFGRFLDLIRFGHVMMVALIQRRCMHRKHCVQDMVEAEYLCWVWPSTEELVKFLPFQTFQTSFSLTILLQFFLNRSTPNARIARENPKTCESIQADRIATVLPGCSSDIL